MDIFNAIHSKEAESGHNIRICKGASAEIFRKFKLKILNPEVYYQKLKRKK
jgi:hypothetical protein